ncbi:hypothetical protein ACLSU7_17210 [Bdellovibrio sp. HCB185ZH]|uniref:hypothetical protein n=1 Tax=Bdellovibrio sp. HCB185ZH TaxID=3394235 RepID=UPI0039A4E3F8
MKNLTSKMIASLTFMAALLSLPVQSLAAGMVDVSASAQIYGQEYGSQTLRAMGGQMVSATNIDDRYHEIELRLSQGYDPSMLQLQTTQFAPVTFTISRDGQVLKTITIPAPGMSMIINPDEL